MIRYTFGDDRSAVERLKLVAAAYEPLSRAFLATWAEQRPAVVLDLGCGPGFTTALLQAVLAPRALTGLDSSPAFLAAARSEVPTASFRVHDVTLLPLPGGPADLIYARLVLAHLPDPLGVAQAWRTQLAPGGILLIEDLEDVEAPSGPWRDYEEVRAGIVRDGGGVTYAGALLSPLGGRCAAVTVPAELAARIYLFNVRRWMADPLDGAAADRLASLEADLAAVATDAHGRTVSWVVRQIAVSGSPGPPP